VDRKNLSLGAARMYKNHIPLSGRFSFDLIFFLLVTFVVVSGCVPVAEFVERSKPSTSPTLSDLIQAGVQNGETTIRIPEGRYEVTPLNGTHLELRYLKGVTLDMRGVEMVCTETTRAILIEACDDLTILGLTIDYDPLPFTQGTLIDISEDRKTHTIQIQKDFPPADQVIPSKYIIMTPEKTLRYGNYYQFQINTLPGNKLQITDLHPQKNGGEQVGDLITIATQSVTDTFVPHAVQIVRSQNTTLEDVTLYASPTFGFFETHSSGSVYRRCVVDRRGDRLRSLNADAFHSKFAEVGPTLEECRAFWQGDDGINICGAYHMVMGSEGDRLRVLAKRDLDIQEGDPVQLILADGRPLPNARVVSVKEVGPTTQEDKERLRTIRVLHNIKRLLQKEYEIQLDTSVDAFEPGGVIGSLNRMGNGFVIRNSEFGHIRSRGILVKGSNGLIEGNLLDHCAMQGIKVAPEYHWLESGFSENVILRNNRILHSGSESILVDSPGPHPMHQNILIEDNYVETQFVPALRLRGIATGMVQRNQLRGLSDSQLPNATVVEYSPGLVIESTPLTAPDSTPSIQP